MVCACTDVHGALCLHALYLSVYPCSYCNYSIHLPVCLCICPFIEPSIYLSIYRSIFPSIYLSTYLSIYVYTSIHLHTHAYIHPLIHQPGCISFSDLSILPSFYPSDIDGGLCLAWKPGDMGSSEPLCMARVLTRQRTPCISSLTLVGLRKD